LGASPACVVGTTFANGDCYAHGHQHRQQHADAHKYGDAEEHGDPHADGDARAVEHGDADRGGAADDGLALHLRCRRPAQAVWLPAGKQQTWGYDAAGRLTGTTWLAGSTALFTQTAQLDAAGQRTSLDDSWGRSGFGYDAAGRLVTATYPDGSGEADQYDAAGNRLYVTTTTALSGTQVISNSYDAADQLWRSVGPSGTTTYSYDGNGNQVGSSGPAGLVTDTFNALNQLTHVSGPSTNLSVVPDAQGDRLRSYEQATPLWTLANDTQDLAAFDGGAALANTNAGLPSSATGAATGAVGTGSTTTGLSTLVSDGTNDDAYLTPGSGQAPLSTYNQSSHASTYLGTDLLGSVRLATNQSDAVTGAGAYDAWGTAQPNTANSAGQTLLTALQAAMPFGYAGQYYDAGPATYDMRARGYDPATGQFLSVDPLLNQTQQPYLYAADNLVDNLDPSGQGWVAVNLPDLSPTADTLIRRRIVDAFVASDPYHLTFSTLKATVSPDQASAAGLAGTTASADVVSFLPQHSLGGGLVGEMYQLAFQQSLLDGGGLFARPDAVGALQALRALASTLKPTDLLRWEAVAAVDAAIRALRKCGRATYLSLAPGWTYPLTLGAMQADREQAERTNSGLAGFDVREHYSSALVYVGSTRYLVFSYQAQAVNGGRGIIGYTVCRDDPRSPDHGCYTPPEARAEYGKAVARGVVEAFDLVVTGGSATAFVDCDDDLACQAVATGVFAVSLVPWCHLPRLAAACAAAGRAVLKLAVKGGLPVLRRLATAGRGLVLRVLRQGAKDATEVIQLAADEAHDLYQAALDDAEHQAQVGDAAGGHANGDSGHDTGNGSACNGRTSVPCSAARCFPAGTWVATPRGHTAIEQLRVGDLALAEDPAVGKVEAEPVQALITRPRSELLALDFSDGSTLKVQPDHVFWMDSDPALKAPGWLTARRMHPGDHLRTAGHRDVTIVRLRWHVGWAVVYTLTVANDHTFFVGAARVMVHNSGACGVTIYGTYDPAPSDVLNDTASTGFAKKATWGQKAMDKVMADNGYVRVGGYAADAAHAPGADGIYRLADPSAHPG